jgi:hypothetical protein
MLSALVDRPLIQNPLAGGGAPQIIDPSVITPRGGAPEVPQPEVYTNPVTKEILDGFGQSDFAKNVNQMQQDSRTIEINGLPITGNGSFIGNLVSYMKSVGKGDMISNNSLKQFEPLATIGGDLNYGRRPNNPSDPILSLNPDFTPSFDLKQADPNNLLTGATPPISGGTFNGMPLFPFPGMNNTETATVLPETLGGGISNLPEFGRPPSPSMFSNTGGIGSLIGFEPVDQTFNGRQTFNNEQAFNEYVDSLVNERLKDFFGGIMGAIDV